MKINSVVVILTMFLSALVACNNSKKATNNTNTSNMKENLIEGTWEANYIMNTPKPFADLYANQKPTITFNSTTGKVNGLSGCNNFNGTFSLDGNKVSFGENMALTRKMCPDMAGESTFLETLKKVNTYSVTEQGKTLNLIMGDMAVMRLTRK
ncbi:MAG: META domain-containing protein [Chitinophagaceae bacterium]